MNMDFKVLGVDKQNVKFQVVDVENNDEIVSIPHLEKHGEAHFSEGINHLHNFIACWMNKDSEPKEV